MRTPVPQEGPAGVQTGSANQASFGPGDETKEAPRNPPGLPANNPGRQIAGPSQGLQATDQMLAQRRAQQNMVAQALMQQAAQQSQANGGWQQPQQY